MLGPLLFFIYLLGIIGGLNVLFGIKVEHFLLKMFVFHINSLQNSGNFFDKYLKKISTNIQQV